MDGTASTASTRKPTVADDTGKTTRTKQGTADIVTALREQSQAPALRWLTEAADEIERLRNHANSYRLDLHATLVALNDLTAIPTHPQHQQTARTTLANILKQRHLTITAIRPHTPNTYGT